MEPFRRRQLRKDTAPPSRNRSAYAGPEHMSQTEHITFDDFLKVDLRVGRIVGARPFPAARKPAYQLEIDFGPDLGRRRSSAKLTQRYEANELLGKQVLAVVNFPPRQIATFFSEVLVLGVPDADGNVVLVEPQAGVPLGGRLS